MLPPLGEGLSMQKKQHAWMMYCEKHAVTDTFRLTSIPLKIYWIPMMSHFSDLSDISLNMYCINSSHLLNTLVIISVPVDTASPSLLYLQSSCTKTSLTACCSMMIYIDYWCFTDRTTLFTLMLILCVCIVCLHFHRLLCVWQSFIKEFYY